MNLTAGTLEFVLVRGNLGDDYVCNFKVNLIAGMQGAANKPLDLGKWYLEAAIKLEVTRVIYLTMKDRKSVV